MPATMAENARESARSSIFPARRPPTEPADEPTADEEERDWEVEPRPCPDARRCLTRS